MYIPRILAVCVGVAACVPAQPLPSAPEPEPGPVAMQPTPVLIPAAPTEVGLHPGLRTQIDSLVAAALGERVGSGVAVAVGRHGRLVHLKGYGQTDWAAGSAPVDPQTIWDLASLTKVVATTTAAMILEEEGRLDLDKPVSYYVFGLNAPDKASITIRQLLTHKGGLEAFAPLFRQFRGREQYLEQINQRPLKSAPGTRTEYSDWDLILLQLAIEAITGQPLDEFVEQRIFAPLGMTDTGFAPDSSLNSRIAATEVDTVRGGLIRGNVHDPNAWAMGGVAGHAGLFSTAQDLAVFAQMLLNGGEYNGVRVLKPSTIARWTAPQGPGSSRALGWDTPSGKSSAGQFFGPRSFGHTGYTGTSLWVDPERGLFLVLLTNRVNPSSANQRHVAFRRDIADAVQGAILDAPLVNWETRR